MKDNKFNELFEDLNFDIEEPDQGHKERFFRKLEQASATPEKEQKIRRLWAPVISIAASLALVFFLLGEYMSPLNAANNDLASISPEMKQTQQFYTGLITRELNALNEEIGPETETIINDALEQMKKLEMNYAHLEKDLIDSGRDDRVIHAMIQNFQQRIDLLNNVLTQIEEIKSLKNQSHENNII
ncbi:DUF4179 domain-containing protein [Christiangramia sabulilitoris]|uniref:DUF4179 domain-containing protein n=2 Tax=Christiangramia sabulilitoris TaxID=2583991 RepID=A0A550HX95_9FLAO|nr:DUF4179 domain-containing protein [Christiangramia sabulilitoris]